LSATKQVQVLDDYLRNNLSTRQICKNHPELNDPNGWKSHYVLKEYGLRTIHKGILFFFSKRETAKLIRNIVKTKKPNLLLKDVQPDILKKYSGIKVLASDDESAYIVFNGELRNLVQRVFKSRKNEVKYCMFVKCRNTDLDTAHRHDKGRKKIFMDVAKRSRKKKNKYFEYPVDIILADFLERHKKSTVLYLCKKHHREYDDPKTNKTIFLKKVEL